MESGNRIKRWLFYFLDSPAKRAVALTGLALAALAFLLFLSNHIPGHLTGEAFADFVYPYLYNWKDSIVHFFMERDRARFLHGVLVTGLYALFGYNPPVFYLATHLLIILGATALGLILAGYVKKPWLAVLLTLTLSLMPVLLPDLFALKKLHHALAWGLFWWSVLFFIEWVRRDKWPWLVGTLLFPLSVLSYEAVGLLFPVPLMLSMPYILEVKQFWKKLGAALFINLAGVELSGHWNNSNPLAFRQTRSMPEEWER